MYKVDIMSCVSDPLLIEEDVFNLWLAGLTGAYLTFFKVKLHQICVGLIWTNRRVHYT